MGENLDLLGWPIVEPRTRAGRPEHVPTQENRNKIMMMLVFGCTDEQIAQSIGISRPTLRKHYLSELRQRMVARLQLDATRRAALYSKVLAGDVSAIKELDRQLSKLDLAAMSEAAGQRPEPKPAPLGKKEAKRIAAAEVEGIFAPRPGPKRLDG